MTGHSTATGGSSMAASSLATTTRRLRSPRCGLTIRSFVVAVKLTGSEFNEFMKDDSVWLKDYWYEDVYALVNGEPDELEAELPDDAKVVLEGGCFYTG